MLTWGIYNRYNSESGSVSWEYYFHTPSGAENISVILVQNYFNILHCCACFSNYLMFSVSVYVYCVLVHCSWRRSCWVCRRSWKEWRMSWTNTPSRWRMPRRSWSKRRKRLQMWVERADVRGLHRGSFINTTQTNGPHPVTSDPWNTGIVLLTIYAILKL